MFATAAAAAAAWAATAFCCCSARVFSIQCLRKGRIADDLERLTSICLAAPPAPTPETELAGGERLPTTLACSYDQIFNIKLECRLVYLILMIIKSNLLIRNSFKGFVKGHFF